MSAERFLPESPLSDREERIVEANATVESCPECGRDVEAVDVLSDGTLYVSHEGDRVGTASRSPRGATDGCRVGHEHDPTL